MQTSLAGIIERRPPCRQQELPLAENLAGLGAPELQTKIILIEVPPQNC
jgi:hypothetical protein